jgi:hypothetical protein
MPETDVKFSTSFFGAVGGNVEARVWAIEPTCGGETVRLPGGTPKAGYVDLFVNGNWQGWVSFGHLDGSTSLTPGEAITDGQVLGQTKKWAFDGGCWEVTSDSGVHTHIEAYNKQYYACFEDLLCAPHGAGVHGQVGGDRPNDLPDAVR